MAATGAVLRNSGVPGHSNRVARKAEGKEGLSVPETAHRLPVCRTRRGGLTPTINCSGIPEHRPKATQPMVGGGVFRSTGTPEDRSTLPGDNAKLLGLSCNRLKVPSESGFAAVRTRGKLKPDTGFKGSTRSRIRKAEWAKSQQGTYREFTQAGGRNYYRDSTQAEFDLPGSIYRETTQAACVAPRAARGRASCNSSVPRRISRISRLLALCFLP